MKIGLKMKDKAFGLRIKRMRELIGLSQEDAANKLGIKYKTYQTHEAGQRPSRQTLEKYLDYYGKENEAYLVLGQGEPIVTWAPREDHENRNDKPPPQSSVKENDGLFARTQHVDVDGKQFAVTTHEPDPDNPFLQPLSMLSEILASGDPILVPAIQANLRAFQTAIRKERHIQLQGERMSEQSAKIKALEDECDEFRRKNANLEERLAALEKKLSEAPDGKILSQDCEDAERDPAAPGKRAVA